LSTKKSSSPFDIFSYRYYFLFLFSFWIRRVKKKPPCSWEIPQGEKKNMFMEKFRHQTRHKSSFFSSTLSPQKNSTANWLQNDTLCDTFT
jgi:hypothetical protein